MTAEPQRPSSAYEITQNDASVAMIVVERTRTVLRARNSELSDGCAPIATSRVTQAGWCRTPSPLFATLSTKCQSGGGNAEAYRRFVAKTERLFTPNVAVAPCADSEMNRYCGFSWMVPTSRPASLIACS